MTKSSKRIQRRTLLTGASLAAAAAFLPWRNLNYRGRRRLCRTLETVFSPPLKLTAPTEVSDAETFDVCIIGSGPAGTVLAHDLVRQGVRTLVLESGPSFQALLENAGTTANQPLDTFRNSGSIQYPVTSTKNRALGGTSNSWTGRCVRLLPIDFLPHDFNAYCPPDAPWPIRYDELEPYYHRAERTLLVEGEQGRPAFVPRSGPYPLVTGENVSPLNKLLQDADVTVEVTPSSIGRRGGGPLRFARDLLPDVSAYPEASIVSGMTATRLLTDADGTVEAVDVRGFDGVQRAYRARHYVLACGALETARLLQLSTSAAFPTGIGNRSDQVGRRFMVHPNFRLRGTIGRRVHGPDYMIGRSLQFYEEFKSKGYGSILLFVRWSAQLPETLYIGGTVELFPSDDNRVTLAPDLPDCFGNPGLDVALSYTEQDHETMHHASSVVRRIFDDIGATEVVRELPNSWSHHHLGTCRMGDDPQTSVVDRNLRVHDSPNLHVLGSSVFVTGGASHPTLAIVALAHRLAEHLTSQSNSTERDSTANTATALSNSGFIRLI